MTVRLQSFWRCNVLLLTNWNCFYKMPLNKAMSCQKKVISAKNVLNCIFCLMLLVCLSFSIFYEMEEAHHDCCGEDCPVCFCLDMIAQACKSFILFLISTFAFISVKNSLIKRLFADFFYNLKNITLVSLKLKLND